MTKLKVLPSNLRSKETPTAPRFRDQLYKFQVLDFFLSISVAILDDKVIAMCAILSIDKMKKGSEKPSGWLDLYLLKRENIKSMLPLESAVHPSKVLLSFSVTNVSLLN